MCRMPGPSPPASNHSLIWPLKAAAEPVRARRLKAENFILANGTVEKSWLLRFDVEAMAMTACGDDLHDFAWGHDHVYIAEQLH